MKPEQVFRLGPAFAEYMRRLEQGVAEQEEIKRRADAEIQILQRMAGGIVSFETFRAGLKGEWRLDRKRNVLVKVDDEEQEQVNRSDSVGAADSDDLSHVLRSAERECGLASTSDGGAADHGEPYQCDSE